MEDLQHEIERQLGRCMLRLQQYELLLKTMMSSMAAEGPLEELKALQDQRTAGLHRNSLGMLVREFLERHLTSPDAARAAANNKIPDVPYASMHITFSMSPENAAQIQAGLAELVALRNDLVHHLCERFDLSSDTGRVAMAHHLESCHARIDGHYRLLHAWADRVAKCQAFASSFVQSKEFEEAFVHGIHPDGTVYWPGASIVDCLRKAEAACRVDGWTSLGAAISFMSKEDRDQVPSRYGCKTWRQVLQRSGRFDIRRVRRTEGSKMDVWYRSRSG